MTDALALEMTAGDLRLEPLGEGHRAALKAACAEDEEIRPIYATSWGPDHFDANFETTHVRDIVLFSILADEWGAGA